MPDDLRGIRADRLGLHWTDPDSGLARSTFDEPVWLDVTHSQAQTLVERLGRAGVALSLAISESFLRGERPFSTERAGNREEGDPIVSLWAFGATAASRDDNRLAVTLQPVTLLVSGGWVLTCRHAGVCLVSGLEGKREVSEPIDLDRVFREARVIWDGRQSEDAGDRDLLVFCLLHALVSTQFSARAAIGQHKTRIDAAFFDALVASRRRAAFAEPTLEQVARLGEEASELVDETRAALNSLQQMLVTFRAWFDDFKPAGRVNRATIWLPETKRARESELLVDDIYRVRNDVRDVRRDIHASMSLLAGADAGAQLLAVRALLDRTDSARRAVIVAGSVTILLAGLALAAAVAAIPDSRVHFPLAQAAAAAGFLILASTLVGVAVAIGTSADLRPWKRRTAQAASGVLASAALAGFALGFADVGGARLLWVILAGLAGALGVVLFSIGADFGTRRRRSRVRSPA